MQPAMLQVRLPGYLAPRSAARLARLGRDHDGGYLVDARDVAAADCLLSLGISDDWSFDRSFVKHNDVRVFAYDGSIGAWPFARRVMGDVVRMRSFRGFCDSVALLAGFLVFFSGRRKHHRQFVGNRDEGNQISMTKIFAGIQARGLSRPFLKIDIEGAEYAILADLISHARITTGLVIEFHDCDRHMEEIRAFVAAYPPQLVHIHANNYAPVAGGIPTVLELTFSSSEGMGQPAPLPHALDMPNDLKAGEISLVFG